MRFLIDENVQVGVIPFLKATGHDAKRIQAGFKNGNVFAQARREKRTLITHDSDFLNSLLYPPAESFGIIFLRINPRDLKIIQKALLDLLKNRPNVEAFKGRLFIVGESRSDVLP